MASANRPHRVVRFRGQLDSERLRVAVDWLAKRATVVTARAVERKEQPYLRCFPDSPPVIEQYWASTSEDAIELASNLVWCPFSLQSDPLTRIFVIRSPDDAPLVGLVAHHIIADDVSVRMMWADLWQTYLSNRSEPEACLQYTDYLAALNAWRKEPAAQLQLSALVADLAPLTDRGVQKCDQPFENQFMLPPEQLAALRKRAASEGVTLACVLLALQFTVLAALSGERRQAVSTVVSGREHPSLLPVAGYLADKTYHLIDLELRATFRTAIRQTWTGIAAATTRQFVRSDFVRDELNARGLDVRTPAFNFRPARKAAIRKTVMSIAAWPDFALIPVVITPPPGPKRPGDDIRDYSLELTETPNGLRGRLLALSPAGEAFGKIYRGLLAQVAEGADPTAAGIVGTDPKT